MQDGGSTQTVRANYTFKTPILWGGLGTVSVLAGYGQLDATVDAVLTGPLGRTIALSPADDRTDFAELERLADILDLTGTAGGPSRREAEQPFCALHAALRASVYGVRKVWRQMPVQT